MFIDNILNLLVPKVRLAFAGEAGHSFMNDLLDYEAGEDGVAGPGDDPGNDADKGKDSPKPNNDLQGRIDSMEKLLKDGDERNRQLSEELKEMREFKKRILGDPDEVKKREKELELRHKFDRDPLTTIEERLAERDKRLDEKISNFETNFNVKKSMEDISKDFEVNWDKDGKKIASYLEVLDQNVRRTQPKAAIMAAMKLAGVFKKKDATPPFVEGTGGAPAQVREKEAEAIKKRLFGNVKKKDNVFNI